MSPEDSANILKQEIERLRTRERELEDSRKALQQEFAKANDPESVVKTAREAIRDIIPDAVIQLKTLINHAESESVRASLSKFVISAGLDKGKFEDDSGSELKDLLAKLSQEPAK